MAGRHLWHSQHGAALLIFLILLVTAALTYVVGNLTPELAATLRAEKTSGALAQAHDALIGHALIHREREAAVDVDSAGDNDRAMYGFLPLPDMGESFSRNADLDPDPPCVGEGCTAANQNEITTSDALVGRLPWRTLGTAPLRDGQAECLWYALSASHRGINSTSTVMNWDTVAAPDIAIGSGKPDLSTVNPHDRPVAVIFSPGPAFDAGRQPSPEASVCGGNYNAAHYVDPALGNAQHARPITGADLFGAIRKHAYFRQDINSLLDRIVGCLRDEIAAGGGVADGKIAGGDLNACYGRDVPPLGYYPNYREMIFVAAPATVNGSACAGAVLFAGQRAAGQLRVTAADKSAPANYLEGDNLANFGASNSFGGPDLFDRVSPGGQSAEQDIVRCIPVGASLNQVVSPALNALGGQLTAYDAASRTLTLGRLYSITAAQRNANRQAFFGCSWIPEVHPLGGGLRSYFKFRILDTGEGFTFAIIDGERNDANVCGAARQHLGYSGSNGITAGIAYPKIGIEIDTTRQSGFNPAAANTLANGRNDPNYTGGHIGIVYWGGETTIPTGLPCGAACTAPRVCSAGMCVLPQAEDDNVHGRPTPPDPAPRPAPRNPPAPAVPTPGAGVYKLDASLSQVPVNQDIHVRVELTRTAVDDANRSKTWLLEIWLLKDSATDANRIAALKNTTRPLALLYPGFAAHLRDTPTVYDLQGGSCAGGATCPVGQTCSASDNMCYTEALRTVRLGFTTSQSTVANDQIINVTDLFTTWIP